MDFLIMFKILTKSFLLTIFLSFLMLVLIAKITDRIQTNSLIAFFGYFCLTLFIAKIFERKIPLNSILIILLTSVLLVQFYTIYLCFVENIFSLPIIIIYCLGIISAFFYTKLKPPVNILPFSLSCLMIVFMFFQGWDYWIHLTTFGNFTGRIEAYKLQTNFEAFDEQKNLLTGNDFQNKIVLLDFWHTRCGICFQKFPQLQAIYEKHKNDSSVAVFAVDKPLEEDTPDQAFKVIKQRGYSFPVVIAKNEDLPEKLGVKFYPTTFVINRNGQIVYKGDIEGAVTIVDELKSNLR